MKNSMVVVWMLLSAPFLFGANADGAAQNAPRGRQLEDATELASSDAALAVIACNCSDGKVCGTGAIGDPFRCCNAARDSCAGALANNPCKPLRCSVAPSCCFFYMEPCLSDDDCGGRPGSCDVGFEFCTSPCDPSVLANCLGASNLCQLYGGALYQVPENTPCDDGWLCTAASPEPTLVDCVPGSGGFNCTRDRSRSDLVDNSGDCPLSALSCSGNTSVFGGEGGPIVGGLCCPEGTACDLASGKCRGNFGAGANSNDVCRAGTCSSDTYEGCPPGSGEAAADASLMVTPGSSLQISWTPACNATDHTVYWGTSPITGAPNWIGAACALGTSGSGSFNPGNPASGRFQYFVVVGRTASNEGSYGRSSAGAERPAAFGVGTCDTAQLVGTTCEP